MAELPFWFEVDDTSWDTVTLGSDTFPGVATVDGAVERKIDVKKSKGNDGATLKDNGYVPAPVTITLTIHTREQWIQLQALIPKIHPRRKGGPRDPVEIIYPSVNLLQVTQIYINKIPFPKLDKKTGILTQVFQAIEYTTKPVAPKRGAGSGEELLRSRSRVFGGAAEEAEDPADIDNVIGNAVGDTFLPEEP